MNNSRVVLVHPAGKMGEARNFPSPNDVDAIVGKLLVDAPAEFWSGTCFIARVEPPFGSKSSREQFGFHRE